MNQDRFYLYSLYKNLKYFSESYLCSNLVIQVMFSTLIGMT